MANEVTCKYCGKKVDKDIAYSPKKGIYYCSENHYLSAIEKTKQKGNHSYKSAIGSDRRNYTDYIQSEVYVAEGFDPHFPNWQIIMSQTNNILKNNPKWTYDTIKYIVWYEKEILGLRLITKESNWSPLSLVEFHAKEAEEYYMQTEEIKNSAMLFEFEEPQVIKQIHKNIVKYKQINIEEVL